MLRSLSHLLTIIMIADTTRMQAYQLKKGGSMARLAILRMVAAESKTNPRRPPSMVYPDWRAARSYTLDSWRSAFMVGMWQGFEGEGRARVAVWYTHDANAIARMEYADKCEGGPDHQGWYSHHEGLSGRDGSGIVRGIVGRLSHGRMIAGYYWGDNGQHVWFPEVFTGENAERDAARMADEHARIFAEVCQEDSRLFDEFQTLQIDLAEAEKRLQECYLLRNALRWTRDEIPGIIETIREKREILEHEPSYKRFQ